MLRRRSLAAAALAVALLAAPACSSGDGRSRRPATGLPPQTIAAAVDRQQVAPGDTVTLTVSIPASAPTPDLYGAGFDVTWDPAVLDLATFDASGSMIASAESGSALQNGAAGRAVCFVSKKGDTAGASGAGTIAELRFTARAAGATALGIEAVHLCDAAGNEYAPIVTGATGVTVP